MFVGRENSNELLRENAFVVFSYSKRYIQSLSVLFYFLVGGSMYRISISENIGSDEEADKSGSELFN